MKGDVFAPDRRAGRKQYTMAVLLALVAASSCWPEAVQARQNILNGKVAAGTDYDSNVYKSKSGKVDEWRAVLAPELSFSSQGQTDSLTVTYAPDFAYNLRREDDDRNHLLSLAAEKGVSSRWKVKVDGDYASFDRLHFEADPTQSSSQNFLRADAATQAEIVRILFPELPDWDRATQMGYVLSQFDSRYGSGDQTAVDSLLFGAGDRQRYESSAMRLTSEYAFAEKSSLVLAYNLASEDYHTGFTADHTRQAPSLLLNYQITPRWRGALGYDLSYDTYDSPSLSPTSRVSSDSQTKAPHVRVDFQLSQQNLLWGRYRQQMIRFDSDSGNDTTRRDGRLGWKHGFDPSTTLNAAVGMASLDYGTRPDEREYSVDMSLDHSYARGTVSLFGRGVTADAEEVSSGDSSRKSWELGTELSHQLAQDLTAKGRLSYGQWDSSYLSAQGDYDRLQVGGGLAYALNQWCTLLLNYDYNVVNTESVGFNDYAEHLLSLRLAAAKELWRW